MYPLDIFNLGTKVGGMINLIFKKYARDFVFDEICRVVDIV